MSDLTKSPEAVTSPPPLDDDERLELERLRQEVAVLRTARPPRPRRRVRWASVASALLLILGLIGVPLSLLAVWTNTVVSNTDRFVATMSPVIENPTVQSALADRVTTEVFTYINVEQLTNEAIDALARQGLPPQLADRLHDLAGPLADSTRGFVRDQVGKLVASPQFATAFNRALQVAHQQITTVLAGDASAISIENGKAVLDAGVFIDAAKQQLVASGFAGAGKIPEVHPKIPLFPADALVRAQTAYQILNAVAAWLPWVTLALLVAGVYLARHHRRAILAVGIGVVVGMLVVATGLLIGRGIVVGALPQTGAAAGAETYDIVVRFLRDAGRAVLVLGLVIALGAFVTGPTKTAVQIRSGLNHAIGWVRRGGAAAGLRTGPVGPWVHAHLTLLRIAAVFVAVLVFVFLNRPSGWDILWVALGLVVVLGVIQFLDQPAERAEPESAAVP